MMKVQIQWREAAGFCGRTGSGHVVMMDGAAAFGGENLGPRPMEMLLLGLGGCAAFDVVLMLQKARQKVWDCLVDITAERADETPKVFTAIHMRFRVYGEGLRDSQVARCVRLSAEKYCSASAMLAKTAAITHDYEVYAGPAPKRGMAKGGAG